jgi:hypothetical protein
VSISGYCSANRFAAFFLFFSCIFLGGAGVVSAQSNEIAIGGIARDGETKKSIPFATIVIRDDANKLIDNVPSDNAGVFKSYFQRESKFYTVEIAMLGYDSVVKQVDVRSGKKYFNLGIVFLKPNTQLNAVYVTAPQLIKPSENGYMYDVSADSTAKKKKVVQLLEKLPFIELDASNRPTYFGGSQSIAYMVNGKYDYSIRSDASVLKMVSGKKIKSIELIPNPPPAFAKNDVVINIITENESKLFEGLLFTPALSANVDAFSYKLIPSANFVASTEHFSYSASVRFNDGSSYNSMKNSSLREKIEENSSPVPILKSNGSSSSKGISPSFTGGIAYQIDKKQSISTNYYYQYDKSDSPSSTHFYYYQTGAESNNIYKSKGRNLNNKFDITYSKGTLYKSYFSFGYAYSYQRNGSNSNSLFENISKTATSSSETKRDNIAKTKNHSLNSIFSIPLTKKQSITFDANYSYQKNKNLNAAYTFDQALNLWKENDNYPQAQDNKLNQGALKTSYSFKLTKRLILTLSGALDYYKNKGTLTNSADINYHSCNFLPGVRLSVLGAGGHSLMLMYSRVASHPSLGELDPTIDDSNPLYVSSGNPNLKDAAVDQFSVGYVYVHGKVNFSSAINYLYTADVINSFSTMGNDGVTYTTYNNKGFSNVASNKLLFRYKFTSNFDASISTDCHYNVYRTDTTRRTFSVAPSFSATYSISRLLKLSAICQFFPVMGNMAQQTKTHYFSMSYLTLSGSSKNMKLSYNISLTNFAVFKFKGTTKNTYEYNSGNSSVNTWYRVNSKSDIAGIGLSFRISYIFGHAKGENTGN